MKRFIVNATIAPMRSSVNMIPQKNNIKMTNFNRFSDKAGYLWPDPRNFRDLLRTDKNC